MAAKIISFEAPEKCFLRAIGELVKSLKQKEISEEEQEKIFSQIQECLKNYCGRLPDYFDDVTEHLERIIKKETDEYEQQIAIDELLIYYELLSAPVSTEIFYQMVENNFSGVYDYPQMTETILLAIIEELIEEQNVDSQKKQKLQQSQQLLQSQQPQYSKQPQYLQEKEDNLALLFYSPSALRRLYWITLVDMRNATEKVLLKVIRNAELEISDFYELAQSIIVAGNTTEKVLLALLERIQQTCWQKEERSYEILREKLYNFILLEGNPTAKVVKKLLDLAQPKGEYYSFYYLILRKYGKNLEIRQKLNEILIRDETNMKKRYHTSRKKLRFLLENGAYS